MSTTNTQSMIPQPASGLPGPPPQPKPLGLDDYLAIGRRRFWPMLAVLIGVGAIALTVVAMLPERYRATGTVAVESQQIPEALVQSTVIGYADQRIGYIKQRLMLNERLLQIAEKYGLFDDGGSVTAVERIEKVRERVFLDMIRDSSTDAIVAFELGFEHEDPQTANAVANELVDLFIEENVKTRTARATETTEFLAREAKRLADEVQRTEARVADFKQRHGDTLPEHLEMRINMLHRTEGDLNAVRREAASLEEEKRFLLANRISAEQSLGEDGASDRLFLTPEQQLAALQVELTQKSSVYGPAHPDLRILKRQIAGLRAEIAANPSQGADGTGTDALQTAAGVSGLRLSSVSSRLASLREEEATLRARLEQLEAQIVRTPLVERELKDLLRDYETAVTEYEEIESKRRQAELAENLEEEEKAERFVLLERPEVPVVPVWPEQRKALGVSGMLAIASSFGIALLGELIDTRIRGPLMLGGLLGTHPIGIIPMIVNSADRRRKRARRTKLVAASVVTAAILLGFVLVFYQQVWDVALSELQMLGAR